MLRYLILIALMFPTILNAKNYGADDALKSETTVLYSKDNNQKIELTILSEDEAIQIFNKLAARQDIPHGYPDGCYARAHKMARIMGIEGIISGKAFIEGEFYHESKYGEVVMTYNVAPVVMVKTGNKVSPYILDPSFFTKPVPYEEWKGKITENPKSSLLREYYTNRFAFVPSDREAKLTEYNEEYVDHMDLVNRTHSKIIYMYNQKYK